MSTQQKRQAAVAALVVALGVSAWFVFHAWRATGNEASPTTTSETAHAPNLLAGEPEDVTLALPKGQIPTGPDGKPLASGPVEVHVTDAAGKPLYGVPIIAANGATEEPVREAGTTDMQGWARFVALPYDGSWHVAARSGSSAGSFHNDTLDLTRMPDSVPATSPRVELQLSALPLEVRAEASDDGRALRGIKCTVAPSYGGAGWETGDLLPLRAAVKPGGTVSMSAAVFSAPAGYCLHDVLYEEVSVSREAKALHAVVPIRPEARLFVVLPEQTQWDYTILLDGKRIKPYSVGTDAFGRNRVRHVPFVPGAQVQILARTGDKGAWGEIILGTNEGAAPFVELKTVKPKDLKAFTSLLDSAQWFALSQWAIRQSNTDLIPFLLDLNLDSKAKRVEVHVRGPDGRPAIGAQVTLAEARESPLVGLAGVTDGVGRAVFTNVRTGKSHLSVWGVGPAWMQEVDVADVKRQAFHLRVPQAATIDLEVVDEHGTAMPHARVAVAQVGNLPWCDVYDGIQRIDPFTDVHGRRVLHNIQPDREIKVTAMLGRRTGEASVTVPAGGTRSVRIVLAVPKPEAKPKKKTPDRRFLRIQIGDRVLRINRIDGKVQSEPGDK